MAKNKIKRPSIAKFLGEHVKIWWELVKYRPFRKNYQPEAKGDKHPVLVIPGFLAGDFSTKSLRNFINKLGYRAYPWELGRNLGDIRQLNDLLRKIETLSQKHETKVSLVGWSLGGVYARQLAKEKPELIRQVITMGSPFAGIREPNNAAFLFKLLNNRREIEEKDQHWIEDIPAPAPVPTTAMYSKDDGIVPWEVCMEPEEDATHQNIEILGVHLAMGHNPTVWVVVEDRLQYNADNWVTFDPATSISHKDVVFPGVQKAASKQEPSYK